MALSKRSLQGHPRRVPTEQDWRLGIPAHPSESRAIRVCGVGLQLCAISMEPGGTGSKASSWRYRRTSFYPVSYGADVPARSSIGDREEAPSSPAQPGDKNGGGARRAVPTGAPSRSSRRIRYAVCVSMARKYGEWPLQTAEFAADQEAYGLLTPQPCTFIQDMARGTTPLHLLQLRYRVQTVSVYT